MWKKWYAAAFQALIGLIPFVWWGSKSPVASICAYVCYAGLGALYAYESQFPGVAGAKIEGLVDRYGISDEATLRFFRVHETADVEHGAVCRSLLDALGDDDSAEAIAAGEELAGALWNFLSGVEASASLN